MKIDNDNYLYFLLGGKILGGGGGGSLELGRKLAESALKHGPISIKELHEIDEEGVIITTSLVGAPAAQDSFVHDKSFISSIELLRTAISSKIVGLVTNENGGAATANGWLQSVLLNIPLIDAPCNGRAHPTGVMGSLNLHKLDDFLSIQAYSGGDASKGLFVEGLVRGNLGKAAGLVRYASTLAGGMVAVARNPVNKEVIEKNAAVGGLKEAYKLGKLYSQGLEKSAEQGIEAVLSYLDGELIADGYIKEYRLETKDGFDVGIVSVDDVELTFWNEYMTAEKSSERLYTFPDLIMTFDKQTGLPLSTAKIRQGQTVLVIAARRSNLILSSTMFDEVLLSEIEPIIGKKMLGF